MKLKRRVERLERLERVVEDLLSREAAREADENRRWLLRYADEAALLRSARLMTRIAAEHEAGPLPIEGCSCPKCHGAREAREAGLVQALDARDASLRGAVSAAADGAGDG